MRLLGSNHMIRVLSLTYPLEHEHDDNQGREADENDWVLIEVVDNSE